MSRVWRLIGLLLPFLLPRVGYANRYIDEAAEAGGGFSLWIPIAAIAYGSFAFDEIRSGQPIGWAKLLVSLAVIGVYAQYWMWFEAAASILVVLIVCIAIVVGAIGLASELFKK